MLRWHGGYGSKFGSGLRPLCRHQAARVDEIGNRHTSLTVTIEEQLKAFLEVVKTDALLQEKLKTVKDPNAAVAIDKAAGFAIPAEDIASDQASATGELPSEELEGVARGKTYQVYNPAQDLSSCTQEELISQGPD